MLPEQLLYKIKIPAYQVSANGQIYHDQAQMIQLLEGKLLQPEHVLIKSDQHALIRVPATLPQHPEGSDVLWSVEYKYDRILPWESDSWNRLEADSIFLHDVQNAFQAPCSARHFMHLGYLPATTNVSPHTYRTALQSIPIGHIHQTPDSLNGSVPSRYLDPSQESDLARMMILLNLAGEASINDWYMYLHDFSSHTLHLLQQLPVENGNSVVYPRTFFGFSDFQEALSQFIKLQSRLQPLWQNYAIKVGESTTNTAHIGPGLQRAITPRRQSAVINALFVFPTPEDRHASDNPNDPSNVWIAPFALCSFNGMGHSPYYLDRKLT